MASEERRRGNLKAFGECAPSGEADQGGRAGGGAEDADEALADGQVQQRDGNVLPALETPQQAAVDDEAGAGGAQLGHVQRHVAALRRLHGASRTFTSKTSSSKPAFVWSVGRRLTVAKVRHEPVLGFAECACRVAIATVMLCVSIHSRRWIRLIHQLNRLPISLPSK